MFEALRKNMQSVQDGITASLQRLSTSDRTPIRNEPKVNLHAGSDLLELYQTQWATMHHMAEQNAQVAEVVDGKITALMQKCEHQHNEVLEIHSLLAHLPNIMSQLHSSLATIGSIRALFEEVEGELLSLENLSEELSQQEKTLDLRMGLALAREDSSHKLKQLRTELSCMRDAKIEAQRLEREANFQSKFKEDMKRYQQQGITTKTSVEAALDAVKLEDITLQSDQASLQDFLDEPPA